jgi:DNA-binding CsgD family transcriptional regulator
MLHHTGRYHVAVQDSLEGGAAGALGALDVHGALLATGRDPAAERRLLRLACRRRLPMVTYDVSAADGAEGAGASVASGEMRARVDGQCGVDALLQTVDRFFSRGCAACGLPSPAAPAPAELSPREQEVLRLLGSGLPCKSIAAQLELSEKTVYTYAARLRGKLHLGNGAELLQTAIQLAHP